MVLPVVLRYPHTRFSPAWESVSIVTHAARLLTQFVNRVEVDYCQPAFPDLAAQSEQPAAAGKGLAAATRLAMAEKMAGSCVEHAWVRNRLPRWTSSPGQNLWGGSDGATSATAAGFSIASKAAYHSWLGQRLTAELKWPVGRLLYMSPPGSHAHDN